MVRAALHAALLLITLCIPLHAQNLRDQLDEQVNKLRTRAAATLLLDRLNDADPDVRRIVAMFIFERGFTPPQTMARTIDLAETHTDPAVRAWLVAAIGTSTADRSPAVPMLIRLLTNDASVDVRANTAAALGRIRRQPELTIPALTAALSDVDPYVRGEAAYALGEFGTQAATALPALKAAVAAAPPGQVVRQRLAILRIEFSDDPAVAVPVLVQSLGDEAFLKLLADDTGLPRSFAGLLLARHKALNPAATPILVKGLEDPDRQIAAYCAQALRLVTPPPAEAVPPLLEIVRKYCPMTDRDGPTAHSNAPSDAARVAPNAQNAHLALSAVVTLGVICSKTGASPQVLHVFQGLTDNQEAHEIDWMITRDLKYWLARFRGQDHSQPAAQALLKTLKDDVAEARESAARSLADFGEHAELVVPALIILLDDRVERVRIAAVVALARLLDRQPEPITLALVNALDDDSIDARAVISETLLKQPSFSNNAVDALIALLDHPEADIRWRAASILAAAPTAATEPALRRRLEDPHPGIRATAAACLRQKH